MDLTPLRPTARCIDKWLSRFGTRLSARIVTCAHFLADGDPRRIGPLSRPQKFYVFAFLRYKLHNPFVVPLHAKLPENLFEPFSCRFAAQDWCDRPSATHPRSCQSLLSMMLVDFALWPSFCSGSRQSKVAPVTGAYLEICFRKGGLWVIPAIQSAY
jgi:hypothetical protein